MLRYFCSIGLLSLLFLAGCDHTPILDSIAPEAITSSKGYFDLLRHQQYGKFEDALDPTIKTPNIHNTLVSMAPLVPAGEPVSVKAVSAKVTCNAGICDNDIVLEYEFPQSWLLVNVVTKRTNNDFSITGFHLNPISESVEETNRFTLVDRKFIQYLFLLPFLLVPLYCLYALLLCIQTKLEIKQKAAWIAGIVLGIFSIDVYWTTGELGFRFFSLHLLSVGISSIPYGSWIVSLSLPVGAIAFPFYRNKLIKTTLQAKIVNKILTDSKRGQLQEEEAAVMQTQEVLQEQAAIPFPPPQESVQEKEAQKEQPKQEKKAESEPEAKAPEAKTKEEPKTQPKKESSQPQNNGHLKSKEPVKDEPKQEQAKAGEEKKAAEVVPQDDKKAQEKKEEKEDKELCTAPASKDGM